ncbi:MAG: heavy metal translocating P-type ATPase [Parachlamydiales bacterium]|jgi:heavy metal translocating P-type ATPase
MTFSENRIKPILFDEFFEMGMAESRSPFLTPASRLWSHNLPLKAALIAGILLFISFVLSFYENLVPFSHLILVFVYFLAGVPALIESIEDLADFEINIDVLMTLAAFSSIFIGNGMEGALLLVLFAISGAMEEAVTSKAKNAISSLHRLTPTKATVVQSGGILIDRSLSDITVGTIILVKSGEVIPLDGDVIEGSSSVNLVHLTGENVPVLKKVGDTVAAGARNLEGALTVKVTHTSADSTLSRIIKLVTQAQESRPRLQRWFDSLSRTYALSIIGLSALFALSFPYIFNLEFLGHEGSVYRALAFLIAASPCALILAIPIAYLSAISACARNGILLKGGITLDALASCKIIAFDKTGTLTTGELQYLGLEAFHGEDIPTEKALSVAYSLERNAVHPIAKAILDHSQKNNVSTVAIEEFKTIPGYGLQGTYEKLPVYLGNLAFIQDKVDAATAKALEEKAALIQSQGELLAFLLIGKSIFLFRFGDELRPHVKEAIAPLNKERDLKLLMLTGDHAANAQRVAQMVGLKEYYADLRPEDKLLHVTQLSEKEGLAMIGDGINDAPALARATVGICMGKVGSATAVDAADIILLQDSIEKLDWLVGKSRLTKRIVTQNLTIATVAILVASIPALAGLVPLWAAVIMHEGGTVLVGLNALRLLR